MIFSQVVPYLTWLYEQLLGFRMVKILILEKVYPLRLNNNLKQRRIPADYIYKTVEDLMRWWKEQDLLKQQGAAEQSTQSARELAQALMAWEDDGGPPV